MGLTKKQTLADLEGYRKYMASKKIQHLQHSRESANKVYQPTSSNFYKH